ncbi:uncharacterized protein ACN427_011892 isoform 1-T2 [Glossina fuscipes fuscipes]
MYAGKQDGESHNEESIVNQNEDEQIFCKENLNKKIVQIEEQEEDKRDEEENSFERMKQGLFIEECKQSCVAEASNIEVAKTVWIIEDFKVNERKIQEKAKVIIDCSVTVIEHEDESAKDIQSLTFVTNVGTKTFELTDVEIGLDYL